MIERRAEASTLASKRANAPDRRAPEARGPHVADDLLVAGDHHDRPAARLGRHQLPDQVVGDHADLAEEHLHPAGTVHQRALLALGRVEDHGDLGAAARRERREPAEQAVALLLQRQLRPRSSW